ncbi:TRAP transporter substrate-binding protein [Salibacterium qingdaonense]|uniref:Tripartite ATP-independent transporter solute receptor, DctP family n=1 Tax=Salibacterium qingdaonense TaxID=266892 RepID=A0A1I4LDQ8_9BACI|nr:TRAP transporter substrate-binding protein [Salibacterium qingdaonense]SFL89061.1 tripartite ATP-independent transporter solute receptor, DctP family [Salibacterium qingdaonense]
MIKKWMTTSILTAGMVVVGACGNGESGGDSGENGSSGSSGSGSEDSVNLIAATQLDSESAFAAGFEKFKEVVEEESDGSVTVEVHTNGDLGGNEDELVQNLKTGSVDLVAAAPGFMAQSVQEVDFFSMPYLFESRDHWKSVIDGDIGDTLTNKIESNTSFNVLGYWTAGVRNYYGAEPIETPSDLDGMSLRTQDSPVVTNTWEALGAQPTSVAWDEMYQALQNNVVDAAENDFTNIYLASHHEVINNISLTQHDYTTRLFFTSDQVMDKLNESQQEAVMTAAEEATKTERETDQRLAEESREAIKEAGVKINEVDQQKFFEQTESVRENAAENLNLVEEYEKVVELKEN